jgi:hypothetical protein
VIHLVVLGQQELDRGPVQAEADLDITRDFRRAQIENEDAGTDADVELARAGPAAQALGDAVVNVYALGFPLGSGWEVIVLFMLAGSFSVVTVIAIDIDSYIATSSKSTRIVGSSIGSWLTHPRPPLRRAAHRLP